MADKKRQKNIEWVCPYCGEKTKAPIITGFSTKCRSCGRELFSSGIDVENRDSAKLHSEIEKRRKKEIIANKDQE